MLSWHVTTTINSSSALGNNGFGRKRLAERSTASIMGTAVTTWSTALACNVGGIKNLAECQGTYWRMLPRAPARFPGEFLSGKIPHGTVSLLTRRDTLTLFDLDCCACSSCCNAGPCLLLCVTLDGVSERILTIFFVFTHKDQWFCAKHYLILGS